MFQCIVGKKHNVMCIGFLLLIYQIRTNLVIENNMNILSYNSLS